MHARTIVTALAASLVMASTAPAAVGQPAAGAHQFERIELEGIDANLIPAMADPERTVNVMVEVAGEPVAAAQADAKAKGQELTKAQKDQLRGKVKDRQASVVQGIEAVGGEVQSQLADAYNGVRTVVKASEIAEIAALPGVVKVRSLQKFTPTNERSMPLLGIDDEVWEDLGLTGEGVSIGIIDTGIDYLHANFGGSGDPADYDANDRSVIEPGSFPTAKVVGGTDFVGDDYDASSDDPALLTPQPDADPLDCQGHGSHVGGTAAGQGVLDGETYTGPYDSTAATTDFDIGPGAAPQAELWALKVFGCDGSTDVTVDAIDYAVLNDLDVINMSLGSSFGRPDDPSAVASDNAAAAGVIVVASAGNSGSAPYITGSPGVSQNTISVAAFDSVQTIPSGTFEAGDLVVDVQNSNDGPLPQTGPVVVLTDNPDTADVDESLGCNESDFTSNNVQSGDIVITFRGVCARVARAENGEAVGAVAVVMVNNSPGFPPFEGAIPGVTIPFLGAPNSAGEELSATGGEIATINGGEPRPNPSFGSFADFTSGGPRVGDSGAKPDITAPGVSIESTNVGSGTGSVRLSGTSMAAPHIAGISALVRQAKPDETVWDTEMIKAALVNTGNPDAVGNYAVRRGGSGLVQPREAIDTQVVAVGDAGSASLSFGFDEGSDTWSSVHDVSLRNQGTDVATFTATVEPDEDASGAATVSVPASVSVGPGSPAIVPVTLTVDRANMPTGLQFASGNVVFDNGNGTVLRVPYQAVPRATSDVSSTVNSVQKEKSQTFVASFTSTDASPVDGVVDQYAWGLSDPEGENENADLRAVGLQAFPDAFGPGTSLGVFAVNTWSAISTPVINEWDVLLDVDEDGIDDFGVIGIDVGALLSGSFDGRLGSFTIDLRTGDVLDGFLTGDFNSSTVLLPFVPESVGLSAGGNEDVLYSAGIFSLEGAPDDFADGQAEFDLYDQPVDTGAFIPVSGNSSVDWQSSYRRDEVKKQGVLGWMFVSPDDGQGETQAQLIEIDRPGKPAKAPKPPKRK